MNTSGDHLVKYLSHEGIKVYKIPVVSKKIQRNYNNEHNSKILNEMHFIINIPAWEGRKMKTSMLFYLQ